ncbi:hypothetical protein [Flaviaesturariibacter terrae]
MKRLSLFCVLVLLGCVAGAQKVFFLYLQSDNSAPFYVRVGEKVSSSTASGYVILSNLRDSSYLLQVGFPGGSTESRFQVPLNGQDRGFVLKQVGGAWNLFDLQELTLLKALAATGPTEEENQQALAQADPFTRRLVQASDDYTLLSSGPSVAATPVESLPPAPMPAVPVPEVQPQVAKADTKIQDTVPAKAISVAAPVDSNAVAAVVIPAVDTVSKAVVEAPAEPVFQRSQVTRRSESSTTEGFGLVFVDNMGNSSDTIRLLIPNPKTEPAPKPVLADTAARVAAEPVAPAVPTPAPVVAEVAGTITFHSDSAAVVAKKDTLVLVKAPLLPADTATAAPRPADTASVRTARNWVIPEATCAKTAESKDFLKLRKNMAAATDEPEMISIARKEFAKRCYPVAQVKLLGTLFLTEIGRYNFFAAAWGHLADQAKFPELEAELKDAYLADRLYELTRHPVQ